MASSSTTVFVSLTDNVNSENNESKTEIASENLNMGKSIIGAPPKVEKKIIETLGIRRTKIKSLNKRSRISVINVELQGIFVQIDISG